VEISDHDLKALSTITPVMWKKIMTAVAGDPVIQKSVAGAVRGDAPTGETTDPVLENILESSLGVTAALTALNGAKVIVGIALICAGITAPEFGPLALIALLVGGGAGDRWVYQGTRLGSAGRLSGRAARLGAVIVLRLDDNCFP